MDFLKKIKPIHWVIVAVAVVALIYLSRKNEYFTLSLNDGGSSMSLNCPPGLNKMVTKNWHKAKLNEMYPIHPSQVHPDEGMSVEMQIVEKCLDPADVGDVRNALMDLVHLMQDLNPSITIKETIEQIHNNHTSYANVFDKLNTVFKSVINNQQIRKCLNMHPNSPVNKYIEEVRVTDMKELNEKLETLQKIYEILKYYENNIALFKNDLMKYLTISVEESNLPAGQKVLHTEVMTVSQHILNKLGNILSNNSSSIASPNIASKNIASPNMASTNMASTNMASPNMAQSRMPQNILNKLGNILSNNSSSIASTNMASTNIPSTNMASPNMASTNIPSTNMASTNMASPNMAQSRMPQNMASTNMGQPLMM